MRLPHSPPESGWRFPPRLANLNHYYSPPKQFPSKQEAAFGIHGQRVREQKRGVTAAGNWRAHDREPRCVTDTSAIDEDLTDILFEFDAKPFHCPAGRRATAPA